MGFYVIVWVLVGGCAALIAGSKGRNPLLWLVLGALFGPLATMAVCFVSPVVREEVPSPVALANRICPHCSNQLDPRARMCRWCKKFV